MQPQRQRQTTTPGRSSVFLLLVVVGYALLLVVLHPRRPFITASSISMIRRAAFNGSNNDDATRHLGISFEVATTRASFLFYNATVASGPPLYVHGLQPDRNTTSIAGVIDVVVVEPSFSAALRAGRLPVRLRLTIDVGFNGFRTSGSFCTPNLFRTAVHLDQVERHFAVFTGSEVTIEKRSTVTFREDGSVSAADDAKLRIIHRKSKMWELLSNTVLKSVH